MRGRNVGTYSHPDPDNALEFVVRSFVATVNGSADCFVDASGSADCLKDAPYISYFHVK